MIVLELLTKQDKKYKTICEVTEQVYLERLRMKYPSFPTRLIVAYCNGEVLGSIGITCGNDETLGIEKFINDIQHTGTEIAEVNRLNIVNRKYQYLSEYLIAATAVYAYNVGVKEIFITAHAAIRLVLRRMNISAQFLKDVDISHYQVEGGEKYRKMKPQAHQINAEKAAQSSLKILQGKDKYFISYGKSLKDYFNVEHRF